MLFVLNDKCGDVTPTMDSKIRNAFAEVPSPVARLTCENLALARVDAELEPNVVDQFTIPTEHEVEVMLVDGQKLRGLIAYVLPEAHSRLTDYLNNSAPAFFPVLEGEKVALVNKRHVAYVETLRR